jgi:MtN3 and saliva related transmembrane protein
MDAVTLLGYLAGALTTMALLPQVIKICRTRSAKDISLVMFFAFCAGIILWIIYGFAIHSMPVIIANTVSLILSLIIILLKLKFQ